MNDCTITKQVAIHCDDEASLCPHDNSELEECNNIYGSWFVCNECDYETDLT